MDNKVEAKSLRDWVILTMAEDYLTTMNKDKFGEVMHNEDIEEEVKVTIAEKVVDEGGYECLPD